jgi:SAM-dependent methyltransferase
MRSGETTAETAKHWEHFPSSIYRDREERNRFVGRQFAARLQGSVLNVGGGGKKHLAGWLPDGARYVEVDIAGTPDLLADLERELPLPFPDMSFDACVCTDVLEHVDNPHAVFAELCRLSRSSIIISLPNAWSSLKGDFLRGTGNVGKFYGLPIEAPADRHKWFFSFNDAERFLEGRAAAHGFVPERWLACGYVHNAIPQRLARSACGLFLGDKARFNLFATTIWVVLERDTDGAKAQS